MEDADKLKEAQRLLGIWSTAGWKMRSMGGWPRRLECENADRALEDTDALLKALRTPPHA